MVEKFKFWCQKVLPTIYDDSLSYYEAICKMATYLNATIDQVNEFQKMIDALPETILNSEEFQKMVQDAVDGKIDALYKVVQDALDAFEAEQDAFEKQVNDSNAAFRQQVNADNAQFKSQVNADNTKFKNDVNSANAQFQQQVNTKLSGYETSNAQFKQEVNTKLTGYETSDAQFKKEVNTKLSGYESDNAQFKSQVNAKVDEIPTKIAEYPKYPLCQNSNGAVTNLFNVLMTYYHNNGLAYGNFGTPFNTTPAGQPTIDCSSLVQLCLMGVPYNQARFTTDEKNVPTSGYYFGDDLIIDPEADRPYGMLSDDMCKWFVEHGYYFETDDPTELKPGDVVFMTFNDESPTYKHVTHCNFFVSYQAITDEIWCIGASTTSDARPFVVSRESYKRTSVSFVGFGRLPLPDCDFKPVNLLENTYQDFIQKQVTLSPDKRYFDFGRLRFNNPLVTSKMYTLAIRGYKCNMPMYFTLQSGTTTLTTISTPYTHPSTERTKYEGEWIYIPFLLNFQNTPEITSVPIDTGTNYYLLSLWARILSTETATVSRSVAFRNCALYEGVVTSPIGAVPQCFNNGPLLDLDTNENYGMYALANMWNDFEQSDVLETITSKTSLEGLLSSKYVKAHKLNCFIVDIRNYNEVTAGLYLALIYTNKTSANATTAKGCVYLIGITTPGIYSMHANNAAWGDVQKIAPYTPAT